MRNREYGRIKQVMCISLGIIHRKMALFHTLPQKFPQLSKKSCLSGNTTPKGNQNSHRRPRENLVTVKRVSKQTAKTRDLQTIPFLMVPKVFLTRFRPSQNAQSAYLALKYFAANRTGTTEFTPIPTMAALVYISVSSFQRGIRELVKKGAVRVRQRTRKTPAGHRLNLPNLYEIVDLELSKDDPI
jgi:hypothetical protein